MKYQFRQGFQIDCDLRPPFDL